MNHQSNRTTYDLKFNCTSIAIQIDKYYLRYIKKSQNLDIPLDLISFAYTKYTDSQIHSRLKKANIMNLRNLLYRYKTINSQPISGIGPKFLRVITSFIISNDLLSVLEISENKNKNKNDNASSNQSHEIIKNEMDSLEKYILFFNQVICELKNIPVNNKKVRFECYKFIIRKM